MSLEVVEEVAEEATQLGIGTSEVAGAGTTLVVGGGAVVAEPWFDISFCLCDSPTRARGVRLGREGERDWDWEYTKERRPRGIMLRTPSPENTPTRVFPTAVMMRRAPVMS